MLSAHRCPRRGLYLITPNGDDTPDWLDRVEQALSAGCALLQYRNKTLDHAGQRRQARALLSRCRNHGVPLVINDNWRLAAELAADGVHLGRSDGALLDARNALGAQAIIGVSCYNQLSLAEQAAADGADYVAFGAFFPSGTKPAAERAELSVLQAASSLAIPKVAIGGIRPDNVSTLLGAGADLIAVIGGIFAASNPAQAVSAYLSRFPEP